MTMDDKAIFIVAVMQAHGVKRLATHNLDDFRPYAQLIEIVGLDGASC